MSQSEIEEVELSIEHARQLVERGQMAERLSRNKEFKTLVLEGYFVNEAARLALLYSDPNVPSEMREHLLRDISAPGCFKRYLSSIVQMGHVAERELREHMETLDEIRAEDGEV
jgi:hypothetical protein